MVLGFGWLSSSPRLAVSCSSVQREAINGPSQATLRTLISFNINTGGSRLVLNLTYKDFNIGRF
jgi:hypothetical protein